MLLYRAAKHKEFWNYIQDKIKPYRLQAYQFYKDFVYFHCLIDYSLSI
jgi:hypothetical protein